MKELSQVDSNFKIETKIEKEDIRFWDIQQPPFVIYGVFHENGKFRRLPEAVANAVNEGVQVLHSHTAGGRVRFRTDSPYIAIHAIMEADGPYSHFAKKFNQLKAKAIYKKTSEKSEVFELFAISSSVVHLYADELEMTKSASFSTARFFVSGRSRSCNP